MTFPKMEIANVTGVNVSITGSGSNGTLDSNGTDSGDFQSYGFENPFDRPYVRLMFITSYSIVFTMCIIGNSMVLFAIARSPRLRSMTNFFLANLAIADFCVGAFCILPNLSNFLSLHWVLGKAMCKIYYYIWNVSYTASIIILTVIAVERYIAIIHPLRARDLMTHTKVKLIQAAIWLIALLYNVPYLFFYDTFSFSGYDKVLCYPNSEFESSLKILSLANVIIWYVLPLILIGFMYYRVALTLWKTTVVSALRLQCYPHMDSDSIKSNNSTKITHCQNDSPVFKDKCHDEMHGHPTTRADSSDDSRTSEHGMVFKGKQTILVVCGLTKAEPVSPNEVRRFLPSSSSDCNESEMGMRMSDMRETPSHVNGNCLKQRYKYRQTMNSNSRRVCRARKKVIKLLISVVISFGVCVLPHMMKVLNHYWRIMTVSRSIDVYLSPLSFIVLYLNSALNPILYALFSKNFRRSFKESVPCFRQRSRLRLKF